MEVSTWRDRWERLKEEHLQLKRLHNDTVLELKRTTTKLRSQARPNVADDPSQRAHRQIIEAENASLAARCRALELRLAKYQGGVRTSLEHQPSPKAAKKRKYKSTGSQTIEADRVTDAEAERMAIVHALRVRLHDLESNLTRLSHENTLLEEANAQLRETADASSDARRGSNQQLQAQTAVAQATLELQVTQAKYIDAQAQLAAHKTIQAQTTARLESLLAAEAVAQTELHRLRSVEAGVTAKESMILQLREDVCLLRQENLELHGLVDSLSSRPFNHDTLSETVQRLMVQTKELEEQNALWAAEHANEVQHGRVLAKANDNLKKQLKTLQSQLEAAAGTEAELQRELAHNRAIHDALQFRVTLLEQPTSEVLTTALTVATRRHCHPSTTDFLADDSHDSSVAALEAKLERLIQASAPTFLDVAKHERVANTYKELNDELSQQLASAEGQWASQLAQLKDELAKARAEKNALQRTLDGVRAASAQMRYPAFVQKEAPATTGANEPLNELQLELDNLELPVADENAAWVIVIDYGAFESQVTPVRKATAPPLHFTTTFPTVIDGTFFASAHVRFELHRLGGVPQTLHAAATLGLESLFQSATGRMPRTDVLFIHPLLGTHVATLTITATLAAPVNELFAVEKLPAVVLPSRTPVPTHSIEIGLVSLYTDAMALALLELHPLGACVLEYSFFGYARVRSPVFDVCSRGFTPLGPCCQRHFVLSGSATDARLQMCSLAVSLLAQDGRRLGTASVALAPLVVSPTGTKRPRGAHAIVGSFDVLLRDTVVGRLGVHVRWSLPPTAPDAPWQTSWWSALRFQFLEGSPNTVNVAAVVFVLTAHECFRGLRDQIWARRRMPAQPIEEQLGRVGYGEVTAYLESLAQATQATGAHLLLDVVWTASWLAVEADVCAYWRPRRHRLQTVFSPHATTMDWESFQSTLQHAM
ncbi:hypothetical protein ACHHYP_01384 [Achlya hypogyna]|uniref:RPGR-interacting protein 1 first C2 domain-containing protein n=1 Tax=Achlya hypogyna TaxID=1202772 RepID=A0A1V9ZTH6_ACHHY|nr:hypothetical protein ACHHYP_01384 [Achlya hypogyna]